MESCFVDGCYQTTEKNHHFCDGCWSMVPDEMKERFLDLHRHAAEDQQAYLEHLVLTTMALVTLRRGS